MHISYNTFMRFVAIYLIYNTLPSGVMLHFRYTDYRCVITALYYSACMDQRRPLVYSMKKNDFTAGFVYDIADGKPWFSYC